MSESNEFPGNITQVQNFLKGRSEVKTANLEYKAGIIQSGILYGLETFTKGTLFREHTFERIFKY